MYLLGFGDTPECLRPARPAGHPRSWEMRREPPRARYIGCEARGRIAAESVVQKTVAAKSVVQKKDVPALYSI